MPELAEVEFYRKQWDPGIGRPIIGVALHAEKRIFRGTNTKALEKELPGQKLLNSETHGKQMLFRFSGGNWLGIHLGMSGKLHAESSPYSAEKHDHLVLFQKKQTLVFTDYRQFGRVLFHQGAEPPGWWTSLPPRIDSTDFTFKHFSTFLQRHSKAPIKAVLLMQEGFPGVGNWMADEILWQSRVLPNHRINNLNPLQKKALFQKARFVSEEAVRIIGHDFSDPPATWLFQHRWKRQADCPRCRKPLKRSEVGGRTTCWCAECQK